MIHCVQSKEKYKNNYSKLLMANHKWNSEEKCSRCGIKRQKRERIRRSLPYSVLGKDGCWYDKVTERSFIEWHYTKPNETKGTFERPDCIK